MTTFVDRHGEELEMPRLSLARLFGLIAYFRQPHSLGEASTELRLPVRDIRKVLDYLRTILVPGEHDAQAFEVIEDEQRRCRIVATGAMPARPPRLTGPETNTLLMTLETLEAMPAIQDPAVVRSAAAKLRDAALARTVVADTTPATLDPGSAEAHRMVVMRAVNEALRDERVLEVEYRNASDVRSVRSLDPVQMFVHEDDTYLRAVERGRSSGGEVVTGSGSESGSAKSPNSRSDTDSDALKSFRIDRMLSARVLDEPARWHRAPEFDPADPHGFGSAQEHWAEVEIDAGGTWVADYDPVFFADDSAPGAESYSAWVPAGNTDRTIGFLLRRWPQVRAVVPDSLQRAVFERAKRGLGAYGVNPTGE